MTLRRHRFAVLLDYERNRITAEAAQFELGINPKTLGQVSTLWAGRLSKIVPIVDRLTQQANTKHEQAKLKNKLAGVMKVTYRQVNRMLKLSEIDVPAPVSSEIRVEKRQTARERRKIRKKHALDVISGLSDVESAALAAEVSSRHIYRLAEKMLAEIGVAYKDLKHATVRQRSKIVEQLERGMET